LTLSGFFQLKPDQTLKSALDTALEIAAPFSTGKTDNLGFDVTEHVDFRATLLQTVAGFNYEVSVGVYETMSDLLAKTSLQQAYDTCELRRMSHKSCVWLTLHELAHIELGHFAVVDSFGIAQRAFVTPEPISVLPLELRPYALHCLELQADHDATEMFLGSYSSDGWDALVERVMAISGMMVLIEREDAKNGAEGRTHPKAAARIFQLLGHLSEMPLIEAQLNGDMALLPSEEELQSFAREVTIPCLFDAMYLAEVAGAETIADDLGRPEDFFKDLELAKLGDPSRYSDLKTQGAQEWAKFRECNEALKPILGGHFTN